MKINNQVLENYLRSSLLGFCTIEELQEMVKQGQVIEVESQQRVPRLDQPQHFYLVLEGEVLLMQRGTHLEMMRREVGRSLELKALLLRHPQWQYDWHCDNKCTFLKIPWAAIEILFQKYPEQVQYLSRVTQSVALQRLKRDLLSLNLSRTTTIQLISKMRLEKFVDIKQKVEGERFLATVFSGEVVVQMNDGQKPFHLTTLAAGDTSLIDSSQSHLRYVPQEGATVWVLSESEWAPLLSLEDFEGFINLFKKNGLPLKKDATEDLTVSIIRPTKKMPTFQKAKVFQEGLGSKSFSIFDYHLWKMRRPAVIASVDDHRTSTSVISFILKEAGFCVRHKEIDLRAPEEWEDKTLASFRKKAAQVGVHGELEEIQQSSFTQAVVVQLKMGFGILYRKHKDFWTVADFNTGSYRDVPLHNLAEELNDDKCFVVHSVDNVFSGDRNEFKFRHIFDFLFVKKSTASLLVLGSFLGFFLELSVPVYSQYMIDQIVVAGKSAWLNRLILGFAVLTVTGILVNWFNQSYANYLTQVLATRLKAFFQSALFRLNPLVVQNLGAPQLLNRISDIDQLSGFFVHQCLGGALSLIFSLGSLSVLWIYEPTLVLLVILLLPVGMLITYALRTRIENLKLAQVRGKSRENRMYLEHFSSNDDMRTLKGVLPARWKWDFNSQVMAKNLISSQRLLALFQVLQMLGSESVKIVAFFYCLHLYSLSQLTLGQLLAIIMIMPKVIDPIQAAVNAVFQYFNTKILITRLNDLLIEEAPEKGSVIKNVEFNQNLRFENVSLGYEKGTLRRSLKNVSFEIKAGHKVIFMGTTGAGKTTLSYLMAGLYEPDQGKVLYDGNEKTKIDSDFFHSHVAVVEQEGRLFSGSILDNIALGEERPNLELAVRCAKAVLLDEDILSRPGGYGSLLLHGGVGLSEGQRQRLLIARALYRSPKILILDEATSYLDPLLERQVMNNVCAWMEGKTLVLFTQRIQMTTKVDQIYFLDDGYLTEFGNHRELMARRENYFKFYLKHLSIG